MSPSFSVVNSVFCRGVIAAAVVVACGSTATLADTVVRSNGTSGIRALSASSLSSSTTIDYGSGFGNTWQFAKFTSGTFNPTSIAASPWTNAQKLTTGFPGSAWNNPTNAANGWTGTNSAVMNAQGAEWISNSNNAQPSGRPTSVLFAIPFTNSALATVANITLTFVSDNGLGNTNGANGGFGSNTGLTNTGASSTFTNSGAFINGIESSPVLTNSGAGSSPGLFRTISTITFSNIALSGGQNWLFLHQFNWGTYGGSAFTVAVTTVVPLPAPVWGGIAGLAGVGGLAAVRRRRMA